MWAPGVECGIVLSLRGGDFVLESGQDLSVGYLDHDARSCASTSRRASPSGCSSPTRPWRCRTPDPGDRGAGPRRPVREVHEARDPASTSAKRSAPAGSVSKNNTGSSSSSSSSSGRPSSPRPCRPGRRPSGREGARRPPRRAWPSSSWAGEGGGGRHDLVVDEAQARADAPADHRVLVDGVAELATQEDQPDLAHRRRRRAGRAAPWPCGPTPIRSAMWRRAASCSCGLVARRVEAAARDRRLDHDLAVGRVELAGVDVRRPAPPSASARSGPRPPRARAGSACRGSSAGWRGS